MKLTDDFRAWVDVAFKIVLAAAGAIVGYYFSFQRQQNEDIRLIVELSTSEKEYHRQLGGALAVAFYEDERIPEQFFTAVVKSSALVENKALAESIVAAASFAVESRSETAGVQQAIATARATLPIRIYFHIQRPEDREAARELEMRVERESLEGVEIVVPGIELKNGPSQSELRCFRAAECERFGEQLRTIFDEAGWPVALKNMSAKYETSTSIRPNHFEAWFAPRTSVSFSTN